MSDKLTIKAQGQKMDVASNKSDVTAAFVRSIVGAAPFLGPMAAELITAAIPNQKMHRVAVSIKVLEDRITYVEEDIVRDRFKTEEFADLLEDALPQMARALTDERKAYIANLLSTSLTDDTLDHLAKKKLLYILNQLNDAEVILLHFYAIRQSDKEKAERMLEEYPFIQATLRVYEKGEKTEKELMFCEYHGNLIMTSLIMGVSDNEYPSPMGYLLLRYIQPDKVSC